MESSYNWKSHSLGKDLQKSLETIGIEVSETAIRSVGAVEVLGNTIIILIDRIKQLEEKVNESQ